MSPVMCFMANAGSFVRVKRISMAPIISCSQRVWLKATTAPFVLLLLLLKSFSKCFRDKHGSFGLDSYSNFRMVGDEVALTAANPKLAVKVSLHPAFQCMVIGY